MTYRILGCLAAFFAVVVFPPNVTQAQSGAFFEAQPASRIYGLGGVSGSSHMLGGSEIYTFSNGESATRSRLGGTNYYSGSTPSLSGSTMTLGGTTFGAWQDGTTSTHSTIGGTTYHSFSDGRLCTSSRIGGSTFVGC